MTKGLSGWNWRSAARRSVAVFAAVAVAVSGGLTLPAVAQDRDSGSFLLLRQLFRAPGERKAERPAAKRPAAARPRKKARKQPKAAAAARVAARPAPAPAVQPKNPDARTVLVVGDFLGSSLAEGLEQALGENLTVKVVNRTAGDSGLVRDDVVDWPVRVGELIEEVKPAAVVAMLGSNDRQAMSVDGKSAPLRSPAWTAAYGARAESLGRAVIERGVPLLWVGLPSFKSAKMSADILAFNDIYRTAAEKTGGEFIDVWEGFVDDTGAFAASGPDVNGQPARLRGSDGINFTAAGSRKLAFYADKPLQKLLAAPDAEVAAALRPAVDSPFIGPPAPPAGPVDRTAPIALGTPRGGETELISAPPVEPAPTPAAPAVTPVPVPAPLPVAAPPAPAPARGAAVLGRADFFAVR